MIRADQIPDEVFYAFQKAWTDQSTLSTKECLAAALNAWPGALVEWHSRGPGIILPLPQGVEASDE